MYFVFKGPKLKDKSMVVKISGNWKEEELEKNLQSVGEAVGNLYKMANDIGQELDKQNQIVTRIGEKSALNKERIAQADKIAQKLLKEWKTSSKRFWRHTWDTFMEIFWKFFRLLIELRNALEKEGW